MKFPLKRVISLIASILSNFTNYCKRIYILLFDIKPWVEYIFSPHKWGNVGFWSPILKRLILVLIF